MHPKERMLRERRLIQATQNNIMGSAGKLGIIAKWLGTPIIRQGSGLFDTNYLENYYDLPDNESLPMTDDAFIANEGWVFDGLSRGMHLEIKYTHSDKKLTVDYKGYRVYTEIAGELDSYAPFSDWELLIERLYKRAMEKKKANEEVEKEMEQKSMMDNAKEFLQGLRLRWGI